MKFTTHESFKCNVQMRRGADWGKDEYPSTNTEIWHRFRNSRQSRESINQLLRSVQHTEKVENVFLYVISKVIWKFHLESHGGLTARHETVKSPPPPPQNMAFFVKVKYVASSKMPIPNKCFGYYFRAFKIRYRSERWQTLDIDSISRRPI